MKVSDWLASRLGYKRTQARRRRNYLAAAVNRFTKTWFGFLVAPDVELWSDLASLRGRSRQLVRDNPHAAALCRVWVDNVAGPDGLQHYPLITKPDGALHSDLNQTVKNWWRAWGDGACTVDGRYTWLDVQRMAVTAEFVDGEFLAVIREGRQFNATGYALQLLDADQLDETLMQAASTGRNEIRMGVELDSDGRPVAYHIWDQHPTPANGTGGERRRIPAEVVLHYFEPKRPGQSRGVPRLTPAMYRLKMMDGYEEAVAEAARVGALSSMTYEQDPLHPLETDDGKEIGIIRPELEAGSSTLLPVGVKAVFHKAEHPVSGHEPFVRMALRAIGAAVGIAYHAFTGDATQANYSSVRTQELLQRDVFRSQHRRLESHLAKRLYAGAMKNALINGALVLPNMPYERAVAEWRTYAVAAFAGRGWTWVDPPKDLAAAEKELALRLNTRSRLARENGRDFTEILRETEQDQKEAAAWGISLPDPGAQYSQPKVPAAPTPKDEETDAIND